MHKIHTCTVIISCCNALTTKNQIIYIYIYIYIYQSTVVKHAAQCIGINHIFISCVPIYTEIIIATLQDYCY